MSSMSGPTTAVVDLEALPALDRLPRDVDRVVTTFQCSPTRRATLAAHFPRAAFVDAIASRDGSWQDAVERDLEALARLDFLVEGVPLLDCFRAVWREELSALRALQVGLDGARRVVTLAGSPSAATLSVVASRGGLEALDLVPGPSGAGTRRPSLLARFRGAGPRGIALALSARLDPSHGRRARVRRRPRLGPARAVLASSYVNATRAALEALDSLGGGPAVLVLTGPGATAGLTLPREVRTLSLATCVSLDRSRAAAARNDTVRRVAERLESWEPPGEPWARWPAIRASSFGGGLLRVLVPEVVSAVVGIRAVLHATRAEHLIVGDEFSIADRGAIHLARTLGIPTVSRQHGVLDSHYLRDRILADEHLAWDDATAAWLAARGAAGLRAVRVVPRAARGAAAPRQGAGTVVVFLQPTDLERVPFLDWLAETVPAVVQAARAIGARVVLKPHPLQTAASIARALPAEVRGAVAVVADRPAEALLEDAAAAVTLDSSVAVDCRRARVPCFSTGWYAGVYAADLEALGYVVRCATPEALGAAVAAAARARVRA